MEPWECFRGLLGDLATEVEDGESFLLVRELIRRKLRRSSLPLRMNFEAVEAVVEDWGWAAASQSVSSSDEAWSTRSKGANLASLTVVVSPVTEVPVAIWDSLMPSFSRAFLSPRLPRK